MLDTQGKKSQQQENKETREQKTESLERRQVLERKMKAMGTSTTIG
jgi:hypothetical protein